MIPELIEKIADLTGFDYTHINNFPMKWYETYGLHTKDYFWDRFTPRNPVSSGVLYLVRMMWWFVYIFPFGLWLTIGGRQLNRLYQFYRRSTGQTLDLPQNPYLDEDHE